VWIYEISEEYDRAILEDELGFYLAQYYVYFEDKSIELRDVLFLSELVISIEEIGEDFNDLPISKRKYDNVYTRDARGMDSYKKIEPVLSRHYFPTAADLDFKRECLVLLKSVNKNLYSVALRGKFDSERHSEISELAMGNPAFLSKLVKPINSVLVMYANCSENRSELVSVRIAQRIVASTKELMGLRGEDDLVWRQIKASDFKKIESMQAKLHILSTVITAVTDATQSLVKERCQLASEGGWLRVDLRSTRRFDLARFKNENPDLYEKYLVERKASFLVKQGRSKTSFPLNEDALRNQIGIGFKALE
jgi:hypothetical protein